VNHPTGSDGLVLSPTSDNVSLAVLGNPTGPGSAISPAKQPSKWRWVRRGAVGGGVSLALACVFAFVQRVRNDSARNESVRELPLRLVSRVDFQSKMTASGRVESRQKTVILCELERISISNEGQTISSGGNAQVIEVVEEGTQVKKGDVLCRLNSNEYEEMVRTQLMKTEQSRAALEQAQLSFSVAELAVGEYRNGLIRQNVQVMEGQIALGESDLERAGDRLRWTTDMLDKGYVPVAQRSSAERTVSQARLKLLTDKWDLENFKKYGNPLALKELEAEVEKRRYEVIANTQRVTRLDERLAHYRKMVDFCTIRSPNDGMVIYAIDPRRRNAPRLEPGVEVRQQQQLFYLPDLNDMEVITYVHESVAERIRPGLSTRVSIEGVGNQTLPGRVESVGPLPVESPSWTTSEEVKYFVAIVKLDKVPPGMLPGMTAEVEIALDQSRDVLAVPTEAVAFERGHDVCYVAGADGLERREITLGRSNLNLLEVTKGLAEGEEVVINPSNVDEIDSLVIHAEPTTEEHPTSTEAGFPGNGPVGVE